MAEAEFAVAQRQVAVAAHVRVEDQDVPGTVHRLDREVVLLGLRREHVLLEILPVAGTLPQRPVEDLRRLHFLVAVVLVDAAHVLLDRLPDRPALRVPEHHPRRFVLQVEEVERTSQLAVVALFRFLDARDVGLEVLLLRPCRAVDSLQHLVARIAAPVRAGQLHQLEHLELARRRHVRTAAQVRERAFRIQRNGFVRRNRRDDLRLVVLAHRFEILDRVVARHFRAHDGLVLFREFRHARLDRGEILGRERALVREVVVEAVLDDRTDRHLRVGKQVLDRVGEQVRRRVPDDVEAFRVLVGDDGERGIVVDHERRVDDLAVDLAGERGLGQAGTDGCGDGGDGHRAFELTDGAVGKSDCGHFRELQKQKSADEPHFFTGSDDDDQACALAGALPGLPARQRCHNHGV